MRKVHVTREELDTIVSALPDHALLQLVIIGRTLLDETRRMLPPEERAAHARAELKALVAALPADEVVRLGVQGRRVLKESAEAASHPAEG